MSRLVIAWAALFAVSVGPTLSAAVLRWEQTTIERVAAPGDREVRAEYRFRNATARTITIQSVATSCSCTTARLAKTVYAPGEAGQIEVAYHVGSQAGLQEKFIYVRTDPSPQSDPDELSLRIKIDAYLSLAPAAAIWSVDNPALEKRITCRALTSNAINLVDARADNPAIEVRTELAQMGKVYYVYLKPRSTSTPLDTTVRLKFAMSDGNQREFDIPAIVLTPIRPVRAQ